MPFVATAALCPIGAPLYDAWQQHAVYVALRQRFTDLSVRVAPRGATMFRASSANTPCFRACSPMLARILVACGDVSGDLRTGTLRWYQLRSRQAKFFRNYIAFS